MKVNKKNNERMKVLKKDGWYVNRMNANLNAVTRVNGYMGV